MVRVENSLSDVEEFTNAPTIEGYAKLCKMLKAAIHGLRSDTAL
jgi:hypothetical protein